MNGIFLSADELRELTGYRRPHDQTRWLEVNAWVFELNGNRRPVVARKYTEAKLGYGGDATPELYKPNFDAIRPASP